MPKKAELPLRIARLQRVIAQPITAPAEQAALDKFRKRQKRRQAEPEKMRRNVRDGNDQAIE